MSLIQYHLNIGKSIKNQCAGWFSLLNWIGALTWSLLLKLPLRKLGPWFILWSVFLMRLLYISINLPYDDAWNTLVTSGLMPLVAAWNCQTSLKKQICRTVVPSLATFLEPMVHCQNVSSWSHFYSYYFGRCSSEMAQLVPLSFSRGRSTCYSDGFHHFSVTIPRCSKDAYVNSFFLWTTRLWNCLSV